MFFDKLLKRIGRTEPEGPSDQQARKEPQSHGDDGWIELRESRIVVHDPVAEGRFPTLRAVGPVRLWLNQQPVSGVEVVTSADEIRWELDADSGTFFDTTAAPDGMSVTLTITADPSRIPDIVTITGQNPATVGPGYTPRAKPRKEAPVPSVLAHLRQIGVTFGIDEAAIERAVTGLRGEPVVIAHGQTAEPAVEGSWAWKPQGWGLVEPGQVVAVHEGQRSARPRIDVYGHEETIYPADPQADAYHAGPGTRLVPGGKIVALTAGRARLVQEGQTSQVTVVPVQMVRGDLEGSHSVETDVLVHGSLRGATVSTAGDLLVSGDVEKSEIRATGIRVEGSVLQSRLFTLQSGSVLPLLGELVCLQQMIERLIADMRAAQDRERPVREQPLRDLAQFCRMLRRKADESKVSDEQVMALLADMAQAFALLDGVGAFKVITAERLVENLIAVNRRIAEQARGGGVTAGSLNHAEVWSARDVVVREKIAGATIFAGGGVMTPEDAITTHSVITAGGEVTLGVLATVRGSAPVTVRARRVQVAEVQMGTVFEFGADRKEFMAEDLRVTIGVSRSGQLVIRHLN